MALLLRLPEPSSDEAFALYERESARLVGGAQRLSATLAMAYVAQLSPPAAGREPPTAERALDGVAVTAASPVTRSPVLRLLGPPGGRRRGRARAALGRFVCRRARHGRHTGRPTRRARRGGPRRRAPYPRLAEGTQRRAVSLVCDDRLGRRSLPAGGYRSVPRAGPLYSGTRVRRRIGRQKWPSKSRNASPSGRQELREERPQAGPRARARAGRGGRRPAAARAPAGHARAPRLRAPLRGRPVDRRGRAKRMPVTDSEPDAPDARHPRPRHPRRRRRRRGRYRGRAAAPRKRQAPARGACRSTRG